MTQSRQGAIPPGAGPYSGLPEARATTSC